MFNKFFKRIFNDNGNAIAVLFLFLIPAILLVGGVILDTSKAHNIKSSYVGAAKRATQAGVRYQNSEGHLTEQAAGEAILAYETLIRPSVIVPGSPLASCKGEDPTITVYYQNEEFSNTVGEGRHERTPRVSIKRSDITKGGKKLENIQLKDIKKHMVWEGDVSRTGDKVASGQYTGIQMQVVETTPNFLIPVGFISDTHSSKSMQCQELGINAGASQFIGEEGEYD